MVRRADWAAGPGVRRGRGKKLRSAFRWRLEREGANSWLRDLAAEDELAAEIVVPEQRPEDAEPQPWHELYWRAFEALRFDRQYGAFGGETPIAYLAISRYAADHGIVGSDFETFHILLTAIDREWLDHVAERSRTADKGTPPPP